MIKVRKFQVPDFLRWKNDNFKYKSKIGLYNLEIGVVEWGVNYKTIKLSISTCRSPLNSSSHLFENSINCFDDATTDDKLKNWLNIVFEKANERFEDKIFEDYLIYR